MIKNTEVIISLTHHLGKYGTSEGLELQYSITGAQKLNDKEYQAEISILGIEEMRVKVEVPDTLLARLGKIAQEYVPKNNNEASAYGSMTGKFGKVYLILEETDGGQLKIVRCESNLVEQSSAEFSPTSFSVGGRPYREFFKQDTVSESTALATKAALKEIEENMLFHFVIGTSFKAENLPSMSSSMVSYVNDKIKCSEQLCEISHKLIDSTLKNLHSYLPTSKPFEDEHHQSGLILKNVDDLEKMFTKISSVCHKYARALDSHNLSQSGAVADYINTVVRRITRELSTVTYELALSSMGIAEDLQSLGLAKGENSRGYESYVNTIRRFETSIEHIYSLSQSIASIYIDLGRDLG